MIKKQFIAANVCLILSISPVSLIAKNGKDDNIKTKSKNHAKDNLDQESEDDSKPKINLDNPYISPEDILSQKGIWLEIHLEERVNTPFFTSGREISRHILNGVLQGKLTPYEDENCTTVISNDKFLKNLRDPNLGSIDEDAEFAIEKTGSLEHKKKDLLDTVPTEDERFRPKDLSILVFKSRLIIDVIRSREFIQIDSVTVRIPAKKFPNGIQKDIASFKFEELQAYFDTLDEDDCWINPLNEMEKMKFSDVFRDHISLWFPQSYLVLTETMRVYGQEPDPSQPLDLKKSSIITEEALLWVY